MNKPLPAQAQHSAPEADCVILLHGLARSASSMQDLAEALSSAGYRVTNVDYPSRKFQIAELAGQAIPRGLSKCQELATPQSHSSVHFITHSMGGILVRYYLSEHSLKNLGRVVMLAPPNQGSEVVDELRNVPGFELLNGPAGMQLGTDPGSIPKQLGPIDFDAGIIAGTRSINFVLSTYLPDPDDGKVSVASAKVSGMCAFLTLPVSHPFIMQNQDVMEQAVYYLENGRFSHSDAESHACSASIQ